MNRIASAAFVALVLAVGCAASESPRRSYQSPDQIVAGTSSGPAFTVADIEAGYRRLFTYTDMQGQTLSQAENTRITAVVFFATWCRPCRRELDWLGDLVRDESRLQIIGINYFDESGPTGDTRVRTFVDANAPWLQVVRADDSLFEALGEPRFVPSMYLFDSSGRLLRAYLPPARKPPTEAELRDYIRGFMSDSSRHISQTLVAVDEPRK